MLVVSPDLAEKRLVGTLRTKMERKAAMLKKHPHPQGMNKGDYGRWCAAKVAADVLEMLDLIEEVKAADEAEGEINEK